MIHLKIDFLYPNKAIKFAENNRNLFWHNHYTIVNKLTIRFHTSFNLHTRLIEDAKDKGATKVTIIFN